MRDSESSKTVWQAGWEGNTIYTPWEFFKLPCPLKPRQAEQLLGQVMTTAQGVTGVVRGYNLWQQVVHLEQVLKPEPSQVVKDPKALTLLKLLGVSLWGYGLIPVALLAIIALALTEGLAKAIDLLVGKLDQSIREAEGKEAACLRDLKR